MIFVNFFLAIFQLHFFFLSGFSMKLRLRTERLEAYKKYFVLFERATFLPFLQFLSFPSPFFTGY